MGAMPGRNVRARGCSLAVVLGAALGALPSAHACAAPLTYQVVIEQMRFNPPTLTVKRGDRVEWVNKDLFAHTASSSAKAFDSGSIAPNASWSFVAGRAGSYPYLCNFHPTMRGTLNVR
ncbi:copper-binding protein [Paraburkholderia panacisoli]|uniref:Copper-binding protein n=2 Tax=Paraburkholderia panacisoli TaxID=2603818 RepID=A0A5B0HDT2_9BURK|nr:copper-binding protein [Paraburkholderia panacisoli]